MATRKKSTAAAAPVRIFVRIGALRRFHALTQKTTDLPVEVTWDRRRSDRRDPAEPGEGERRQPDRRQKPPFTWDAADFVVVEEPVAPPKAPTKKR
jgi:hypothetical protein